MAPVGTRAVLLRAHPYGETSRILRFYTEAHGLLGVVARGVRGRGGKGGTVLATFATGDLTAYVRANRDLHTMKDFACSSLRSGIGRSLLRFAGASAVAELVVVHTDQEAHPKIFRALESALDSIETVPDALLPTAVLSGAWQIVAAFGFAPEMGTCAACGTAIRSEEMARFDAAGGGVLCAACGHDSSGPRIGPLARAQLSALIEGSGGIAVTHPRRHFALLSDFVAFHVAERPLRSFGFLLDHLPPDEGS